MNGLLRKKNIAKIVAPVILLVGLSLSLAVFHPSAVFAAPGDTSNTGDQTAAPAGGTADTATTDDQGNDEDISCAIEKMGWVLCPLIETAGRVGDQAFNFLASNFLETEPELISSGPNGTRAAWEMARNLANVMFIVVFLIIILSQVTGQGLNNYGLKKMLPRLVVAALAVNVSYYICQLMVDLTNILGYEVQRFLVNTSVEVSNKAVMPVQTGFADNQTSGGSLGAMSAGILGLGAVVWFLLPMLFLGVTTVVITCIVIVFILLMRKAFIVLLVVVSPIAFVMYLLPNTESLFKKWGKMFWQLLLVFPIVGLLFGGGQLASAIVLVAGSTSDAYKDQQETGKAKCIQLPASREIGDNGKAGTPTEGATAVVKNCGDGSTPFLLGLVAAGIAVAPMIAVWAVLKGALSAAGAIGGKIGGAIQNTGNGMNKFARRPEEAAKKAAFNAAGNRLQTKTLSGDFGTGTARFLRNRQTSKSRRDARLKTAQSGFDASPLGQDKAMELLALNQAASAADSGLRDKFVAGQLRNPDMISSQLGTVANDEVVGKALGAQQAQALASAVKDIELSIDTSDLGALGDQLADAVDSGDRATARALQNVLLKSGSAGMKEFHSGVAKAEAAGHDVSDLRSNIRSNFGGIKDSDPAMMNWATDSSGTGLASHFNDSATYSGLNASQFAGLSSHAQEQAVNNISARALDDLAKSQNAQMLAQVKGSARSMLAVRDGRFR